MSEWLTADGRQSRLNVLQRLLDLKQDDRFIVACESWAGDTLVAYGGSSINAYKTIRGAMHAAKQCCGVVLQLRLSMLPMVDGENIVTSGKSFTEFAFAERQATMWGERAAHLAKEGAR